MVQIHAASIAEFLRAILPTESHFPSQQSWVFRGQGNADWGLVPSIRREKTWLRLGGAERYGLSAAHGIVSTDVAHFDDLQKEVLRVLADTVDLLALPGDLKRNPGTLMGLAQHIGLPTFVLDWTYSPMVAAYFAAADAVQLDSSHELAVYAVSAKYINESAQFAQVERLRVPSYGNPNLFVQQGVLLDVRAAPADLLETVERRDHQAGCPLPEAIANHLDSHLLCIRLASQRAGELLKTLREQGIHAGTAFPGHIGVAELVREIFRTDR